MYFTSRWHASLSYLHICTNLDKDFISKTQRKAISFRLQNVLRQLVRSIIINVQRDIVNLTLVCVVDFGFEGMEFSGCDTTARCRHIWAGFASTKKYLLAPGKKGQKSLEVVRAPAKWLILHLSWTLGRKCMFWAFVAEIIEDCSIGRNT